MCKSYQVRPPGAEIQNVGTSGTKVSRQSYCKNLRRAIGNRKVTATPGIPILTLYEISHRKSTVMELINMSVYNKRWEALQCKRTRLQAAAKTQTTLAHEWTALGRVTKSSRKSAERRTKITTPPPMLHAHCNFVKIQTAPGASLLSVCTKWCRSFAQIIGRSSKKRYDFHALL